MQVIDKWLKGNRNFYVGVSIYKGSGNTTPELLALFNKGKSAFAEKKLLEALTVINEQPVVSSHPVVNVETDMMLESNNQVLASLRSEWLPIYQQMNYLRHQLDKYTGDSKEAIEARKPIAFEIIALEKQCMLVWEKRDYYIKNNKLPLVSSVEENEIPKEPAALARFITNCERYIRRHRKNMLEMPGNAKYAQLYNQYKALYQKATGKEYKEKEA